MGISDAGFKPRFGFLGIGALEEVERVFFFSFSVEDG